MFSDVPPPRYQNREPTPPRASAMSVDFGGFFWGEKELVGKLGEVQCILIVIKC